jgi:hypothetical protein
LFLNTRGGKVIAIFISASARAAPLESTGEAISAQEAQKAAAAKPLKCLLQNARSME